MSGENNGKGKPIGDVQTFLIILGAGLAVGLACCIFAIFYRITVIGNCSWERRVHVSDRDVNTHVSTALQNDDGQHPSNDGIELHRRSSMDIENGQHNNNSNGRNDHHRRHSSHASDRNNDRYHPSIDENNEFHTSTLEDFQRHHNRRHSADANTHSNNNDDHTSTSQAEIHDHRRLSHTNAQMASASVTVGGVIHLQSHQVEVVDNASQRPQIVVAQVVDPRAQAMIDFYNDVGDD